MANSWISGRLRSDNERLLADYGAAFVSAWKITHNYRVWFSNKHPAMAAVPPGCVRVTSRSVLGVYSVFFPGSPHVCCAADTRSRASTV